MSTADYESVAAILKRMSVLHLSSSSWRIAGALLSEYMETGDTLFPWGANELADRLVMHRNSIANGLAPLEDRGIVKRGTAHGGRGRMTLALVLHDEYVAPSNSAPAAAGAASQQGPAPGEPPPPPPPPPPQPVMPAGSGQVLASRERVGRGISFADLMSGRTLLDSILAEHDEHRAEIVSAIFAADSCPSAFVPAAEWGLSEQEVTAIRAGIPDRSKDPKPVARAPAPPPAPLPPENVSHQLALALRDAKPEIAKYAARDRIAASVLEAQIVWAVKHGSLGRGNEAKGVHAALSLLRRLRWERPTGMDPEFAFALPSLEASA